MSLWINGLCVYKRNITQSNPEIKLSANRNHDDIHHGFMGDENRSISPYPRLEV